jgi:hypothetical protein
MFEVNVGIPAYCVAFPVDTNRPFGTAVMLAPWVFRLLLSFASFLSFGQLFVIDVVSEAKVGLLAWPAVAMAIAADVVELRTKLGGVVASLAPSSELSSSDSAFADAKRRAEREADEFLTEEFDVVVDFIVLVLYVKRSELPAGFGRLGGILFLAFARDRGCKYQCKTDVRFSWNPCGKWVVISQKAKLRNQGRRAQNSKFADRQLVAHLNLGVGSLA